MPSTAKRGELIVMLRADMSLTFKQDRLETLDGADISDIASILSDAGASLRPLFGTNVERLDFDRESLMAQGLSVPKLSRYYVVDVVPERMEELAGRLRASPNVEAAYIKPPAEPALYRDARATPRIEDAPPTSPDFSSRQVYLGAAPTGVDARYAWTVPGGRGTGVNVIDVEGAWNFAHEDLRLHKGGVLAGSPTSDPGWVNHGTAVLGEIAADHNGFGVMGICPEAYVSAISIFGLGSSSAIHTAAQRLTAGDIILVELHRPGPRHSFEDRADQKGYVAVEWWPDDYDAIKFATSKGIIVVEAAGNGAENLDDTIYNNAAVGFPSSWGNPFWRGAHDSGAVLVGAGAPPPGTHGRGYGPDRSRLDFSNYGSAVDVQGWGREVTTTGYGDLQGGGDENAWYTDLFAGTSSASPIVVGVLGSAQGVLRAKGHPLTPTTARSLLRTTGSPQQDGPNGSATQRIGNRPDLRQILNSVGTVKVVGDSPPEVQRLDAMSSIPELLLPPVSFLAADRSLIDAGLPPEPDFAGSQYSTAPRLQVIAKVTSEPRLPPINVPWYWNSPGFQFLSATHTGWITFTEHGRADRSQTLSFATNSLPTTFNFGSLIMGGMLTVQCVVHCRRLSDGAIMNSPMGQAEYTILGDNPSKVAIKTALPDLPLQVIAYMESRFRQFDNTSMPLFGPPNGFGVMQLDTPRPTAQQVWSWKDNISGGMALYSIKKSQVSQHFQNIYSAHPEAPKLTAEQFNLALYQFYNGGFYWDWDAASKSWKKVGVTSYGDAAMTVETAVRQGHPPGDWSISLAEALVA